MDAGEQTSNREIENAATPLSTTEQAVAAVWSEVLQIGELPGAGDDFFDLGGDSMTMVLAEFRILEEFRIQLPTGAMLSARTVRDLSVLIDERAADAVASGGQ